MPKISELMKQTEERIKAFEERPEGAPFKDEEKKAIKDNLKRVLALKKLQKEKNDDDAEISEEDIKTKIQDEVFFSTMSKEFQLEDYKFAVENMDTIFETSEKINENHPEFVKFQKIVNSSMFFQKDSPDSLGKANVIKYSYTRSAVHSIAAMKVLLDHKDDIEKGEWTMEHFFSPDSLEERQKAFDAVWEQMQQNNEKSDQWIAEQIYGGMQLGAKLSQDAVNKIDWNLSSSELLKKDEFIRLAAMQYFLFDVTQEQDYCKKEFIELIKKDHKGIDAKDAYNDDMFMIKNGLHAPCGLLYNSYNTSVKSLCTCYYNQMNVNQSFMKVDTSQLDSQSKNIAESYVEERLSKPLEEALESMELIDRISDRIKAHNKSLKNLIDDFDHLKNEDFLKENENINEGNKATIEKRRKQRKENYPPLESAAAITYTPTLAKIDASDGAQKKEVGKVFKHDPTGKAAIKATEDAISGKLTLQDLKDKDFDFKENYEPRRNQNLQAEYIDPESKFFNDFYKDLKNFNQKDTKGHKIIMFSMAEEVESTLRRMEKTNNPEWLKNHGDTFTLKPVDVMRRLLHLRDKVEQMEDSNVTPGFLQAKNKFLQMADKHIKNPANAQLVEEARKSIKAFKEKNKHLQERIDQLKQKAFNHGVELKRKCEEQYGNLDNVALGNVSRFYRSVVGGMQHFTKETDEQIIEDFHEMFKDNSVKAKQARAKNAEKIFKTVLEFDEKKATYNSVEELWNDKKHEDLLLLSSALWDSEGFMNDYQKLLKDPNVDTKLNEDMFKEVKSKIQVLMGFSQISIASTEFQKFMTGPFAIDADINKMKEMQDEKLLSACMDSGDPYLNAAYAFVFRIKNPDLRPNETFDAAVERQRIKNGLAKISPDERKKHYQEIIGAIQNEEPLVLNDRMQKSAQDEQKSAQDEQKSAQDEQKSAQDEQKSAQDEQGSAQDEQGSAQDEQGSALKEFNFNEPKDNQIDKHGKAATAIKNIITTATVPLGALVTRPKNGTDSATYTEMKNALEAISRLKEDAEINVVKVALTRLQNASERYTAAHTGWKHPFSGNTSFGKFRVQKSRELAAFAHEQLKNLSTMEKDISEADNRLLEANPAGQPGQAVQAPEKEEKKQPLNHGLDKKISDAQAKIRSKDTSDKELKEAYATIIVAVYIRNKSDNIPQKGKSQVDYQLINDTCTFESLLNIMLEDTKWIDNMNRENPMKLRNAALKDNGGQLFDLFAQEDETKEKKVKPQKNQTAAAKTKKKSNGNINPQNDSGIKTDEWVIMEPDKFGNNKKLKGGPRK